MDPLESIENCLLFSSRDMSDYGKDAWIYGIIIGWGDAINEVAGKHNWGEDEVQRLHLLHNEYLKIKEFHRATNVLD